MKVTQEMLYKAIKKAVELGILPKHSSQEDYLKIYDSMRKILETALDGEEDDKNR